MRKSNFELSNLSTWSLVHRILGFLVVACAVLFLAYTFIIKEKMQILARQKSSLNTNLEEYQKKSKDFAELKYIREEVGQLKIVLKETIKYLPTNDEWPAFVNNVYKTSLNNGINFDIYKPKQKIEDDYYMIQPIELTTESGFKSVTSFVQNVTSLNRIMNVQNISVVSKDKSITKDSLDIENRPVSISGELRTYIFKDE